MKFSYSENLKSAIRLLGNRLSTEERRMLIEIVGFAFEEGKISGKEELLRDSEEENKINLYEEKETKTSTTEEDFSDVPF
jgi:hypothetical protein